MITTVINNGPKDDAQTSSMRFSSLVCLTADQETMITQRITSVLKKVHEVPQESRPGEKLPKIPFGAALRAETQPLFDKAAKLDLGSFNSVHESICERGRFLVEEVDPVLRKWNASFRWYMKTVWDISGMRSRGSWNNDRTIFNGFGEHLLTDPDVRSLPLRKLLVCAKHDNPIEFVRSSRDLIHKSSQAELEELVTGKKREKREPTPDRHFKYIGVRAYWNEQGEELRLKGTTPELQHAIYTFLEVRDNEARDMDNALSTIFDDGSLDWTGYWAETAKNSEITIRYTTADGQFTFWDPEKGQVPYGTWAEVVEAVRIKNAEAYIVVAEGPEHKVAETSLAESVPQTYVTIPTELLDQLPRKREAEEKPDSVEEPDQTGKAAETSEQAEAQDHTSSPEDETPEGDDQGAEGDSAPEDNLVERVEADGWTPGEGWTEERPGSFNLTQAFKGAWTGERYVRVRISCSGKMDDSEQVDILHEVGIPCDWDQVIGFLEGDPFAMHRRNAKLVVFTTEGGKPYLCATNGDKWKIWLNAPAISLSRR